MLTNDFTSEAESQVPALARALQILEALSFTVSGMSYSQLREKTGIPPASLTRIVGVLTQRGYLAKASDGTYRLGLRLYAMGAIAGQQIDVLNAAAPILSRLRDSSQETVELGIPDGMEVVIAAKLESARSIRLTAQVGYRLAHLHASGLGKAMLAFSDAAVFEKYLAAADWKAVTPTTITNAEALRRDLAATRARGYGYDDCEIREDVRRFGAPVFDAAGALAAVITLAGPAFRMPLDEQERFGGLVKEAAKDLSRMMGWSGQRRL